MCNLMWEHGRTMRVVHQDELSREDKDVLRMCGKVTQHGKLFLLEVEEEPEVEPTTAPEDALDEQDDSDEPTLEDLEGLTVAQLKDLAAKEEVDVSDLKLKADLVGRLCAHFGVEPSV